MDNNEFLAIKMKYIKVIQFMCYKYRAIDSKDELKQLADIALWQTILKYDNNKSTFTTYLTNHIRWTFLSHYRKQKRNKCTKLKRHNINNTSIALIDLLDPIADVDVFIDRFISNLTLKEIAIKKNTNITKIVTILEKIKQVIQNDMT